MKVLILALGCLPFTLIAQEQSRKIEFPDIPGYETLVCDLHQHTVFSDGSVWPDIRVREAIYDGVDANAIFIEDANKLLQDDPLAVFREAKVQGAFVCWNHPHWTAQYPDGVAKLTDMHKQLIKENLLHGIEVVNETTYSDEALEIALENNLAIMGTSDIHGLIDWLFDIPGGGHRPVSLVFATERSQQGIKDALFEGRSVAWHRNSLIGKQEFLVPLIASSLEVKEVIYPGKSTVAKVVIQNRADADYILKNQSQYRLHEDISVITLKAHEETLLQVKTLEKKSNFDLSFEVLNALTKPDSHPVISMALKVE